MKKGSKEFFGDIGDSRAINKLADQVACPYYGNICPYYGNRWTLLRKHFSIQNFDDCFSFNKKYFSIAKQPEVCGVI